MKTKSPPPFSNSNVVFPPHRVPLTVASNLVQANIHYPGRLVGVHRSGNHRSGNHGTTRNAENLQATGGGEDIATVTALQQQIIATVASVEIQRKDVDGQPEDTELDVTGLGAGGDSDQRMLLAGSGGVGVAVVAAKEGSVGKRTGSKQQKKIFIRNGSSTGAAVTSQSGDASAVGVGNKEKPMVTIVTIGSCLEQAQSTPPPVVPLTATTTTTTINGTPGEESEEDKIDILAHL